MIDTLELVGQRQAIGILGMVFAVLGGVAWFLSSNPELSKFLCNLMTHIFGAEVLSALPSIELPKSGKMTLIISYLT